MSSEGGVPLGGGVKRVDVVELRKKIAAGLGQEKVRKYWDILMRFTQFKLSKDELDTHARQVLPSCRRSTILPCAPATAVPPPSQNRDTESATGWQVLGADYLPLHNELIHGIFQNAMASTINPPAVETPAVPLDLGEPLGEGRPSKKPKKKVGPGGQVLNPTFIFFMLNTAVASVRPFSQ